MVFNPTATKGDAVKTKAAERIERINKSKSWTERIALARGILPATRFDTIYLLVTDALRYRESHAAQKREYYSPKTGVDLEALNTDTLAAFGEDMARAMQNGNSDLFREWVNAIDEWHRDRPEHKDRLRAEIIKFFVPPTAKFQMRDLIEHLRRLKFQEAIDCQNSTDLDNFRRKVRAVCKQLGFSLKGKRGRPRKIGNGTATNRKLKS